MHQTPHLSPVASATPALTTPARNRPPRAGDPIRIATILADHDLADPSVNLGPQDRDWLIRRRAPRIARDIARGNLWWGDVETLAERLAGGKAVAA